MTTLTPDQGGFRLATIIEAVIAQLQRMRENAVGLYQQAEGADSLDAEIVADTKAFARQQIETLDGRLGYYNRRLRRLEGHAVDEASREAE